MASLKKDQRASRKERYNDWKLNKTNKHTWQQNGQQTSRELVSKQKNKKSPEFGTHKKWCTTQKRGSECGEHRQPHMGLLRVPEGEGNGEQEMLEESVKENFPKPVEYTNPQIQEAEIIPKRKSEKKYLEKPRETAGNQRQWKYFKRN